MRDGAGGHPSPLAGGVDIFFVISGFVMVMSTESRVITAAEFLRARLARIVPLYWAALSLTLVLIAVGVIERPMPLSDELVKPYAFIFYQDAVTGTALPFLVPGWPLNYTSSAP